MPCNEVELLAPAGKWDVLERVVEAGADAVYLGGKRFNMRMLRPEFNFSNRELKNAANYLHQRDKKLYITLNNLYYDNEIEGLKDYMLFLQEIMVDALIVQDTGIISIYEELGLNIPLHASVQMGISNLNAVKFLEDKGFSRVILSKNVSLDEIESINKITNIGLEYFAHGDTCISHTGQCYMSSFIAGKSSNRGECIKPCRWKYSLDGKESGYFLAHKDLCLYPYLFDLMKAGIISFKIEGRMRSADYLTHIIKIYREALNEIIKGPQYYEVNEKEFQKLYKNRIRDFSTGNLFGRPGLESIGITGEREPFFPTTAVKLKDLKPGDYQEVKSRIDYMPRLSVKVGDIKSIEKLCDSGINNVILGLEGIRQNPTAWDIRNITQAVDIAGDKNIGILLETPRILNNENIELIKGIPNMPVFEKIEGIIINDYGSYYLLKDMGQTLYGGVGLNVTNSRAVQFLKKAGLKRITTSQELQFDDLKSILESCKEIEIMVHGPLCGIITDFCLARAINGEDSGDCSVHCLNEDYALMDDFNQQYLIRTDTSCRNYVFYPHDLCLFPYLPLLISAGLTNMRIDGQYYDTVLLLELVQIYKEALESLRQGKWDQKDNYNKLLKMFPQGLTGAPLFRKQ